MIKNTKQCVENWDKCPDYLFKFNFICYEQCPEFTIDILDSPHGKICICNKNGLLFLDYKKNGNIYYQCGLNFCPEKFIIDEHEHYRKNLLERENKCVDNCTHSDDPNNKYLYSFRNICIQKCPTLTLSIDNECIFYDINDDDLIDDLKKLTEAANVQAKELYEKSNQLSGYLMNKFNASMQIYALNKSHEHKKFIMKSNLTYIDLGTCLEKIYSDNNLDNDDKILVAKYDLLPKINNNNNNQNSVQYYDKYLINQVEYEFYLLSTMEKIDGSVCSPFEIEISYPIFFNKNQFDNYINGINDNKYSNLFMLGKKLHEKDKEIDTFNKENKIYKELCLGIEIDGKDLVLEDRYKFLYPNNISLCESNCTMKNTDFELQRINCMCTYKQEFDLNRVDQDNNDIINDKNFLKVGQSSANIEIIKCFAKVISDNKIFKNEAFYYGITVFLIEVIMALGSFLNGIKFLGKFIRGILTNKEPFSVMNNNPGISNGHMNKNNPPKKGELYLNQNDINSKNALTKNNLSREIYNDNDNGNVNYGIYTKSSFPRNKNKINTRKDLNDDINMDIDSKYNFVNLYQNKKAEFIPFKYNFKFFKPNDKGVVKKIERSKLPFKVDKRTKILLELKNNVTYNYNYLKGPFYKDQNIIEIIDDDNDSNSNNNKNIKFNETSSNIDNDNNNNNNLIRKRIKNNKSYLNIKEDNKNVLRKNGKDLIDSSEKNNFIKIKTMNPIIHIKPNFEEYKEDELKNVDSTTSIFNLMKREHTYLRVTYEQYISKKHPNILATFLAEIFDKIYFIKIFLFLKKFELLSIHISLYMFYHILLLSLICGFFTINTIKIIYEDKNYTSMNFYLLYGLISNIIIWIVYRVCILLLDNQDKIRALVNYHNEVINKNTSKVIISKNNVNNDPQNLVKEKYDELVKKIKIQTIAFYTIILVFTLFFFIYLVSFSGIYTATKGKVFKTYYISIIEIALIKFLYGLCLASLRVAAESNKFKNLYSFVVILDKYVS